MSTRKRHPPDEEYISSEESILETEEVLNTVLLPSKRQDSLLVSLSHLKLSNIFETKGDHV